MKIYFFKSVSGKNMKIKEFCTQQEILPARVFIEYKYVFYEIGIDSFYKTLGKEELTWGEVSDVFNEFTLDDRFWPIKNKKHLKNILIDLCPEELV